MQMSVVECNNLNMITAAMKNENNGKKKKTKVKVFTKKKKYSEPESVYIEKLREKYDNVRQLC